ncbi:MAG TPA: CRISPR-associated endonuclease Cas1 [Roseburia sp.]|nr:CRISPR-associated endonuclease Cas1 [Roseburia sp.]
MSVELCINDVVSDENINIAMESLLEKRDSCGVDGVKLSELPAYWNTNGDRIKKSILDGTYVPGMVNQIEIINQKGKHRMISLMNSVDRLIYRALFQKMTTLWEKEFSACSYAYQDGKGVLAAVKQAAQYIEEGNIWCIELDIHNFFDNINHELLLEKVRMKILDEKVMNLIIAYLRCTILDDHITFQKKEGILQGGPLSPLLSNIYMDELDHYMDEKKYSFCRFGDDINIYVKTYDEAVVCLNEIREYITDVEILPLNQKKTGVFQGLNRKYLGYRFEEKNKKVLIKKEKKAYRTVYRDWYTTGIQRVDNNYHLINEGILTKRDFNILFEGGEGKRYIPVETTDALFIYSNVILTGGFLEFVNQAGLNVCVIDKYGEKVGSFVPQNNRRNIKMELKQLRMYDSETKRLAMARKLEIAGISNIRANLRYYERRKESKELQENVDVMSAYIKQLNEAKSINELMLIEAQARQKYYQCFNYILDNKDFNFEKRTRRPPQDPINAMISFGNTLLYQRIANEINRTSLDIRIGIVHAAGSRPESLNLDLADLFKPILVDRAIFTLINRKMISGSDFIEVENNGIYLSKSGKKAFIKEFENKIYQKVKIDGIDRTYDYVIKREIQKLKREIETGEVYKPYKYV